MRWECLKNPTSPTHIPTEAIIAFYLFPVSFNELKQVADDNLIMPPKSTYILPKMRSGLIVQPLKEWV